MGKFAKKTVKAKQKPIIDWTKEKLKIYNKNNREAIAAIQKKQVEIRGFILRRLTLNTMWVLRKVFKFSPAKFKELDNWIDYMSDIVTRTKYTTWDAQMGLEEECKYKYRRREKIEFPIADWILSDDCDRLISYQNLFDSHATNLAIPLSEAWESFIMWILHAYMGFGAVRLKRFQDQMSQLWSKPNDFIDEIEGLLLKSKCRNKLGTNRIALGAI